MRLRAFAYPPQISSPIKEVSLSFPLVPILQVFWDTKNQKSID